MADDFGQAVAAYHRASLAVLNDASVWREESASTERRLLAWPRPADGTQMFGEQLGGQGFVKNRGIQQHITAQGEAGAAPLQVYRLGGPAAQIHRQHLVALLRFSAVNKSQSHVRVLAS